MPVLMGTLKVWEFLICSLMKRYMFTEVADRNGCFLGGGERGVSIRLVITDSGCVHERVTLFSRLSIVMEQRDMKRGPLKYKYRSSKELLQPNLSIPKPDSTTTGSVYFTDPVHIPLRQNPIKTQGLLSNVIFCILFRSRCNRCYNSLWFPEFCNQFTNSAEHAGVEFFVEQL